MKLRLRQTKQKQIQLNVRTFSFFQSHGLLIDKRTSEPSFDFNLNPHKMSAEVEATMKIKMEHVSLYFVFYVILIPMVLISQFLAEFNFKRMKKRDKGFATMKKVLLVFSIIFVIGVSLTILILLWPSESQQSKRIKGEKRQR